ncbi:hypothetical protein GOD97_15055, partial [Paeniclostridium sordellii]|uniref:two-component regulator propeller domain-containing protein n=1 Tax=Paraclostridium sordellii TaxID=1505 RepID=UPI0012ED50C4
MKIKLYKKLSIILIISLGIFGMVGCESSSKVGNLNNVVSEKLYTTDDIKKEIKTDGKKSKEEERKREERDSNDSKSIPNDNIGCIKKDSRGNVWIGTANGLAKYNKQSDNFNV